MGTQRRQPQWKRILQLLGLMGAAVVASPAQAVDSSGAEDMSQEWDAYARFAGTVLQSHLDAETEAGARFHQFMQDKDLLFDREPVPLLLRVWLDDKGNVIRLQIEPELGSAQAERDIEQILMTNPMPLMPPSGMPMPLLVRLQLLPKV